MLKKILALVVMLYATLAMAAVDVNKATDAQLDSVKGIGPETSKIIRDERKKGEFKSWEDLISRVKGMGEKRAANLSEEGLTVNGKSFKKKEAKVDAKDVKNTKAAVKEEKKAEAAKPAASAKK